jgi:hypothetical protein
VRDRLNEAGIRVVQHRIRRRMRMRARSVFVRSIKEECLGRMILLGERHFRRAMTEFVAHYHRERNHQGRENSLIERSPTGRGDRIHRQQRLGGLLNYYRRAA